MMTASSMILLAFLIVYRLAFVYPFNPPHRPPFSPVVPINKVRQPLIVTTKSFQIPRRRHRITTTYEYRIPFLLAGGISGDSDKINDGSKKNRRRRLYRLLSSVRTIVPATILGKICHKFVRPSVASKNTLRKRWLLSLCTLGLALTLLLGNRMSPYLQSSTSGNKGRQGIMSMTKSSQRISGFQLLGNLLSRRNANDAGPRYGSLLVPRDVLNDKEAKVALGTVRNLYQKYGNREPSSATTTTSTITTGSGVTSIDEDANVNSYSGETIEDQERKLELDEALELLKSTGGREQATLTLRGYKGGKMNDQVNQDRAFVISPFNVKVVGMDQHSISPLLSAHGSNGVKNNNRLLGVFDGHAKLGELVSEYTAAGLPKVLFSKLESTLSSTALIDQTEIVHQALVDTFVEIDKMAPADPSGGCTASVILQLGHKIYVANAGDSRSIIATYNKSSCKVGVVYVTREDKPDLPQERARVERMGGEVYIPPPERAKEGASSRVIVMDKKTNKRHGLAMSRSIGDWEAGKVGVIPHPTVVVLDILELLENAGGTTAPGLASDNVGVFAVSATDGLLDFVEIEKIVKTIAWSLYQKEEPHLLSACENLITTAAISWSKAMKGTYRDDIAIAVSKMSL